ncbi:uncharacterized protein LOC129308013 [Prosopis cineraria]|uniref:uncharacterized protein LOC129308013 n=1 Tax=Prosopis cineraria TaxID=364024 RepID=UPI00240F425A|nr:uncharacterized protein LOC129308013 [Prosopis cineraria]
MSAFEERPLVEHGQDFYEHEQEGSGCGCFRVLSFRWWRRQHDDNNDGGDGGEGWLMNKLGKMKEGSEVIAGPRWKTFIRKMNLRKQKNRFQYDEHSYALNFNSEANSEEDDEDLDFPPSFTSRFIVPIRHTNS